MDSYTFNRTSLESKLELQNFIITRPLLLIEPVWNRNLNFAILLSRDPSAFNRTSLESKLIEPTMRKHEVGELLIEPVWNRNNFYYGAINTTSETFNRTSLESKPG